MENAMGPEERADLERLLASVDFDHPDAIGPCTDADGAALVLTPDIPRDERDRIVRRWRQRRGPSRYRDLPMPVVDVKAGGKAEGPWRLVAPLEIADIAGWNLRRLGYPATRLLSYREGGHGTNDEGRAEMAWRQWPDWGFLQTPYIDETDAPRRLVADLIDRIVASKECEAWVEDEYGFKGYKNKAKEPTASAVG